MNRSSRSRVAVVLGALLIPALMPEARSESTPAVLDFYKDIHPIL